MKNSFRLLLLLACAVSFFFCEKEKPAGDYRLVILSGNNQNGQPGDLLSNEIVVQALKPDGTAAFSHPVYFKTSSGTGISGQSPAWSQKVAAADEAGLVKIKWQLGCAGEHKMIISLLSPGCSQLEIVNETCQKLATVEATAASGTQTGWVKSCGFSTNFGTISRLNAKFKQFPDGIFMIAANQVFRSTDDGVNWEIVPSVFGPGSFVVMVDFTISSDGTWFAADNNFGVSRSTDEGKTWKNLSTPFLGFGVNNLFANGDDLYAVAQFGGGFFVSHDRGDSWEQMNVSSSQSNTYPQIAATPDGSTVYAFNEFVKLFKTSNGGATWTAASLSPAPATSYAIRGFRVNSANKLVFLSDFYSRIYETSLAGVGNFFSFSTSSTGGELGFLYEQGNKNWLLNYGDPFNSSDDQIMSGSDLNYTAVDLKGFDKPLETFFITASGKLILTTMTDVYTYRN